MCKCESFSFCGDIWRFVQYTFMYSTCWSTYYDISDEWKPVDEFIRDRIRLDGCLWTRERGEMGWEWMDYQSKRGGK